MPSHMLLLAATVVQGAAAFSHGSSAGNSLGFATWSAGSLSANPLALTNKGGSMACRGGRAGAASPLMMAGGFGKQTEEPKDGMNRDQRRAAKKQRQMEERAMKTGKAKGMQRTGEILSDSIDGKDSAAKTGAPKKPLSLQSVKEESMRLREESLKNAAKRKKEGDKKQQLIGLPLEDEVQSVPVETLESIERTLLFGVVAAGALWILAGLGTAFDAYMIATKQTVPPGIDEALSKYVEPFLTPGLAIILLGSITLGGLQIYKFEGGRK